MHDREHSIATTIADVAMIAEDLRHQNRIVPGDSRQLVEDCIEVALAFELRTRGWQWDGWDNYYEVIERDTISALRAAEWIEEEKLCLTI
jgi:hypothetical protein